MTQPSMYEGRPPAGTALEEIASGDVSILAPTAVHHPKAIFPTYAILVQRRDGALRRQLYISLNSAQKAMDRAQRNGVQARCQLVEIVPVPALPVIVVGGEDR